MIPYIKDSWRGGISDEYTRGVRGSFKYAYGVDIHNRRDSVSCNNKMVNVGTWPAILGLIKYSVTAKDGSTYCFGANGSVYSFTGDPDDMILSACYNDENGEIRGAAEFQGSDDVNYLYWATATSVARVALDGSLDTPWAAGVATQDYKTTLDDHPYHTMKNIAGGLMIANGNYVATISYGGDFDPAAMNISPGNVIKCMEERDSNVILGSEREDTSEEGHLWLWVINDYDNLPDVWSYKKKIPVRGVNALIDTERLLLQGGIDGELFYSDFQNASPLNSVYDKGSCNSRIDVFNDLALFGMYGTEEAARVGIYSYGRRALNRPFAMNNEFKLNVTNAGSTVTEIGATWVASSAVFASWQTTDGSTLQYGVDMVSYSTKASARLEGLEFTGGQPHLKKTYMSEKLTFEPLPASCSISVLYKPDRQSTGGSSSAGAGWKYAKLADGTGTTYSVTGSTEAEFLISDRAKTFEIGVELTPSGSDTPEITGMVGYIKDETSQH